MDVAVTVNLAIVLGYLLAMLALGVWLARYVKEGDDYFIAGRSLNRWVICGSVMSTNVAAMYLIGPAGRAFESGAVIFWVAWSGNVLAAVSAVTFLPRFRRMRITTITELLQQRYGSPMSYTVAIVWLLFYTMFGGITMLTCARVMEGSFGIPIWLQLPGLDPFETVVVIVGVTVVLYCLFSGLLAVVYTDLLQAFLMILGAVILLPLTLRAVGGVGVLFDPDMIDPSQWVMWRAPGPGVDDDYRLILMLLVQGLSYWFASQYMLQRSFAGRNVEEASKGLLWAALLTGPLMLCYLLPAMAASASGEYQPENPDQILPILAQQILPIGLGGLFLAALIAASNSTASSVLNSLATLFQRDLYRPLVTQRSDQHYLLVGRMITVLAGLGGISYAIAMHRFELGILDGIWLIASIFQPAIFVVVAGALFFRWATLAGGLAALFVGVGYGLLGAWGFWEGLGERFPGLLDVPLLGAFLGWDHTFPATRALVNLPLSLLVLVGVSYARPRQDEATQKVFTDMRYEAGDWTPPRLAGFALALGSALAIVGFAFVDAHLPKPWNVPLYLLLLSGFVGGLLISANAFLPKTEVETPAPSAIEGSFIARFLGTGWTWAIVCITAAVLVVLLYGFG